ncbi:MAG TPA: hypothetical protein VJM15_05095 [Sphingomicrobium sp.]|nr:hypothetical protein [Sphingomicrobium sp.]
MQSVILDSDPDARRTILCRILGHRRSGTLAFTEGNGIWKSRCKRCGTHMVRMKRKRWVAAIVAEQKDKAG